MPRLLALLVSSAIAIATPALAQSTPSRSEPQPEGFARLTGRVVARNDGAPVRRVLVRLSGVPQATQSAGPERRYIQRELETDDQGGFEFADLPGGSYSITVSRANGFLELSRATQATVGEGRTLDLLVRLERTGAIAGRITDGHGDGVLGVEVQALRRKDFRGHVTLVPVHSARTATNDLGQFRLFNLPPGEYLVLATPVYGSGNNETSRRSGFIATYYPGTQTRREARFVTVGSGTDSAEVDFSLASGTLARIAIDAVDSQGVPLGREASATLTLLSDEFHSSLTATRQATRQDGGRFVFSDIPAGDYSLIVSTSFRREEAAYLNVTVDGDASVKVQTNAGARISGRFVLQGPPRDRTVSNVVITATPPPAKYGPSYVNEALVHPQGTDRFELTGLRGPMVLHAQMTGVLLASITRAAGEDLAGKTLHFTGRETIDDLLVVFTTDRAEAEVTLTGLREPEDPENVLVVLFADDPERWHAGWLHYTTIQASAEMPVRPASANGGRPERAFTLRLGPVVPGRYLIAAVPNPEVTNPTQPAVLERLRALAVPVTLAGGETTKVEVRIRR